ncbi:hypothetical protein [Streptomyces spirodelae]|uniref:Molecular chaperone DnaJ n=1 Tax=Streptomyces spirodelae TaxID=2812904 RepID=A0ABS3X275_9ACTN|nr:hypothetical protein [Streptomyces spirodelae]MBO8189473.1 hypothetical protein [Streptomyces spirodelae]
MTQPTPARARHCRDCDGFSVVHIDTGTRQTDGTRHTTPVTCRTCNGTGTRRSHVPAAVRSGK